MWGEVVRHSVAEDIRCRQRPRCSGSPQGNARATLARATDGTSREERSRISTFNSRATEAPGDSPRGGPSSGKTNAAECREGSKGARAFKTALPAPRGARQCRRRPHLLTPRKTVPLPEGLICRKFRLVGADEGIGRGASETDSTANSASECVENKRVDKNRQQRLRIPTEHRQSWTSDWET